MTYSHSLDPDFYSFDNTEHMFFRDKEVITMDIAETIYQELRHIAHIHRRKWSGNSTLNTTALISEAWLKMNSANAEYQDKTHFYATAARVMRQVLINYAERNSAQKRISPELEAEQNIFAPDSEISLDNLLFINELLVRIEQKNDRGCRILECRIFGGMTIQETSKALGISLSTVKREWSLLSAWLYHELDSQNISQNDSLKRA